jgi:dCMP deaminase
MKHNVRLNQAVETASFSKCISRHVGAIIVKNNHIIAEGYNGTPKGYPNCCDVFKEGYTSEHHEWSMYHEIHAEMNAIIWAAREGISIDGGIIYTTTKPCRDCTKHIIASGIKSIFYGTGYFHNNDKILDKFLKDNNVTCELLEGMSTKYPMVMGYQEKKE